MKRWMAVLAAAAAMPVTAQQSAVTAVDEATALARAGARGALLLAYDRAASLGTDELLARFPQARDRAGGYIVDGPGDAPRLFFVDRQTTPQAIYVVQFRPGEKPQGRLLGPGDDRTLPALDQKLIAARVAAAAAMARDPAARPCAKQSFNTVVLPPEDAAASTRVYFLTPQTSRDSVPFGGHYLVEVAADGRAGTPRAFTRSCIDLAVNPAVPAGGKSVGVTVSHLLDPVPTEIHVFASYTLRKPVYVVAVSPRQRVWAVTGARIAAVPVPVPAAP